MSDDALARTVRALRETHAGASVDARASRAIVLALTASRRKRRLRVMAVLVPLAAVLVFSTAWAAATGRMKTLVDSLFGAAPSGTRSGAVTAGLPAPPSPTSPAVPYRVEPDAGESIPSVDVASLPVLRAPPSSTAPHPVVDAATDAEEDLYAVAHRAHFVNRDPAGALKAWDAYLAAYPRGRFTLEARYNRALSLVRLGRKPEARGALAPFADGRSGGYRQREARELLDALDAAE